jgi:hypothetical protein
MSRVRDAIFLDCVIFALPRGVPKQGMRQKNGPGVSNKHITGLKFDNQIPINHVRTAEADIDATYDRYGSSERSEPDHIGAGQLLENQRSL